jgi:hypothetical protein
MNVIRDVAPGLDDRLLVAGDFANLREACEQPLDMLGAAAFFTTFSQMDDLVCFWTWGIRGRVEAAYGVAADGSGNLIIAGIAAAGIDLGGGPLAPANPNAAFLVASYAVNGSHLWSRLYGASPNAFATRVAANRSGDVVVAGTKELSLDFGDGNTGCSAGAGVGAALAVLSNAGNVRWSRCLTAPASTPVNILAVAIDGDANVYAVGTLSSPIDPGGGSTLTPEGQDGVIASYGPSGAYRWAKRLGGTGTDQVSGVAVDAAGSVVVTGMFAGTADLGGATLTADGAAADGFVAAFAAADGAHRWAYKVGGSGDASGGGVAVDAGRNVYAVGEFVGSVDLGGASTTSRGERDLFVVSLGAAGAQRWAGTLGGSGMEAAKGVVVLLSGRIAVYGAFTGSVDFGGAVGVVTSVRPQEAFVLDVTP